MIVNISGSTTVGPSALFTADPSWYEAKTARDGLGGAVSFGIRPGCDGCGACVSACPRGAIRLAAVGAAMPYEVAALECNDCWSCAPVCPRGVLGPDPHWAVCRSRGCPLSSRRLSGWACTEGWARCPKCNSALWKPPGSGEWRCARCDLETRVVCPKARMSSTTPHAAGSLTT